MPLSANVVFSIAFIVFCARAAAADQEWVPIVLSVQNDVMNVSPESHAVSLRDGGVLLGALHHLQESQQGFTYKVEVHPDFGLWLQSVNGVAADKEQQTYWELLREQDGDLIPLDVGVGCYTPKADEHIVLRFTSWKTQTA